ncbi:hypothetical protein DQ04_04331000 [Trypanosoma grayi]|uniref:hypothetical protein n=1 Tax=Trypanosoma grayi TaxID=71804 RepID=UPI0004F461E9|nr:hypothetical protein DQ04_04331000 [Trypanosoma grayi]KEG09986.1 hypothetical protein DQ04_04331000 [Trypanosoma grayi]
MATLPNGNDQLQEEKQHQQELRQVGYEAHGEENQQQQEAEGEGEGNCGAPVDVDPDAEQSPCHEGGAGGDSDGASPVVEAHAAVHSSTGDNSIEKCLLAVIRDGAFGNAFTLIRDVTLQQEVTSRAIVELKAELGRTEEDMRQMDEVFKKVGFYVQKLSVMRSNMEVLDANMAKTKRLAWGIRERLQKTGEWGSE